MLRFNPELRRIKRFIDEGVLGTIVAVNHRVGSYITLVNSRSRYQADIPGALLMDYAHQTDILRLLLDRDPSGVYCAAACGGNMELSSRPNILSMICDYEDPLIATITLNYVRTPERNECEVIGDRGWVVYDLGCGELRLGFRDRSSVSIETVSTERDEMYREEHRIFLEAIAGRSRPSSPPDEALSSMYVIDACMKSLDRRERVEIVR